jgi:hypothetical protein
MKRLSSWKQITINQYSDVTSLVASEYSSLLEFKCHYLSILYDCEIEDIENLTVDELTDVSNLPFLSKLPTEVNSKVYDFELIPFNKLTLGQFIDLENFITDVSKVSAIIYHRPNEQYNYDIKARANIMNDLSMHDLYGAYTSYLNYRENIINNSGLFESAETDEDDPQPKSNKYAWEMMVNVLSNDDITKYHKVLNLSHVLCFNYLSMKKSKLI